VKGYSKTAGAADMCDRPGHAQQAAGVHRLPQRTLRKAARSTIRIRPHLAEAAWCYYAERAALGLDLFTQSPWARLPGAHNRLGERQTKLAGATGRVASARTRSSSLPSSRPFASSASLLVEGGSSAGFGLRPLGRCCLVPVSVDLGSWSSHMNGAVRKVSMRRLAQDVPTSEVWLRVPGGGLANRELCLCCCLPAQPLNLRGGGRGLSLFRKLRLLTTLDQALLGIGEEQARVLLAVAQIQEPGQRLRRGHVTGAHLGDNFGLRQALSLGR
jgi:hypothetical protein